MTMPKPDQLEAVLKANGLKKVTPNLFNQAGRSQGICRGMCLDWLRRALLGGSPVYKYERTEQSHGIRRDQLTAAVFKAYGEHAGPEALKVLNKLNAQQSGLDAAKAELGRMKTAAQSGKLDVATYQAAVQKVDKATDVMEARAQEYNALRRQGTAATGWPGLAMELDRARAGAKGQPSDQVKRKFSDLRIVGGSDLVDQGSNAGAAAAAVAQVEELAPSQGLLLSWTQAVGKDGHAVAVTRSSTAAFILFDPNYGMFIGQQAGAMAGIQYLVQGVFPEARCLEYLVLAKAV